MSGQKPQISIDITSDTVCPWCYVGKKRLEKAMDKYKGSVDFKVTWHPYFLDPTPRPVQDKFARYQQKFGPERAEALRQHMTNIGKTEGINFTFDGVIGPTHLSHRLIHLAQQQNKGDAVVSALFTAYFENAQNIFDDVDTLARIAASAGMEYEETKAYLESDKGTEEVVKEVREASKRAINGVPHFVIDGRHELHGAQDPALFEEVFDEILSK
ncbi:hypothetical protein HK104_000959 [Borealophlyctis nickersoniae]|nr:hypothetical protein HK104_000959 [Borealophlyctis nickersoniae]